MKHLWLVFLRENLLYLRASPSGRSARRWVDLVMESILRLTSTVSARPLYPCGPRASFCSHSLTPLSHIALASEPAYILVAGSLYRLGQRQKPATVRRNMDSLLLSISVSPGLPAVGLKHR
jgi:hypothetical protein